MPLHDGWLMPQDNEDVKLDIAHSLYATAKQLDPSRPVNTADGVWGATAKFANPQDFRSTGFALFDIPIGDPHQFSVAGTPPVPIIDHEMGEPQTVLSSLELKRSSSNDRFELDGSTCRAAEGRVLLLCPRRSVLRSVGPNVSDVLSRVACC